MAMTKLCLTLVFISATISAFSADRTAAEAYLAGVPPLVTGGDYKAVEDLCKLSLRADDTCPLAHYYNALCLEKTNKAHDAFKEYQNAAALAAKEKDAGTAAKSTAAAKRIGGGLMEIDALDSKLADKLIKIGAEAIDSGRLETAKQTFATLLVLQPENVKAKEGLEKATKALKEHVNPIKAKIAAAMLSEVWYRVGNNQKSDAVELAKALTQKYTETEWAKEAAGLLDRDFAAPKTEEVASLAQKIKEQNAAPAEAPKAPGGSGVPPKAVMKSSPNIDAIEKTAAAEVLTLSKDMLMPAFADAYKNGKSFYAKATPGSDGNQENLSKALEQFIRAGSIFARIETENLRDDDISENAKEVAMLRYACMKMTVLTH